MLQSYTTIIKKEKARASNEITAFSLFPLKKQKIIVNSGLITCDIVNVVMLNFTKTSCSDYQQPLLKSIPRAYAHIQQRTY